MMTSGNKADHEGIPKSLEDELQALVRSTQKNVADWKTRIKRKRFRFQNIQGTVFGFLSCLGLPRLIFIISFICFHEALKTITVERSDLSIGLTQLFCQNSDYEILELIQDGINLEKMTTLQILEVFYASQSEISELETKGVYDSNEASGFSFRSPGHQ